MSATSLQSQRMMAAVEVAVEDTTNECDGMHDTQQPTCDRSAERRKDALRVPNTMLRMIAGACVTQLTTGETPTSECPDQKRQGI